MARLGPLPLDRIVHLIRRYDEFMPDAGRLVIGAMRRLESCNPGDDITETHAQALETLCGFNEYLADILMPGELSKRFPEGFEVIDIRTGLIELAMQNQLDEFVISPDRPFEGLTIEQMEKDIHLVLSRRDENSFRGLISKFVERTVGPLTRNELMDSADCWHPVFRTAHIKAVGGEEFRIHFNLPEAFKLYKEGSEYPEERYAALLSIWLMVVDDDTFIKSVNESVDERVARDQLSELPYLIEQFTLGHAKQFSDAIRESRAYRNSRLPHYAKQILTIEEMLNNQIASRPVWPYSQADVIAEFEAERVDGVSEEPGLHSKGIRERMKQEILRQQERQV